MAEGGEGSGDKYSREGREGVGGQVEGRAERVALA